jgi:hypothetical protein
MSGDERCVVVTKGRAGSIDIHVPHTGNSIEIPYEDTSYVMLAMRALIKQYEKEEEVYLFY